MRTRVYQDGAANRRPMHGKHQASTRSAAMAAAYLKSIQLPPQVPRPLHEFLVLVLPHFHFPLPLHADRLPPASLVLSHLFRPEVLPLLLPLPHSRQELRTGHR